MVGVSQTTYSFKDPSHRARLITTLGTLYSDKPGFWMAEDAHDILFFLEPLKELQIVKEDTGVVAKTIRFTGIDLKECVALEELNTLFMPQDEENFSLPRSTFYVRYEALHLLEKLPQPRTDLFPLLPLAGGFFYRTVLILSSDMRSFTLQSSAPCEEKPLWELDLEDVLMKAEDARTHSERINEFEISPLPAITKEHYCDRIIAVQEAIQVGDVYQVNLSQQFTTPTLPRPFDYYSNLRERAQPAHGCFFSTKFGELSFSLSCASPELFFRVRDNEILCSPIKGTRARTADSHDSEEITALRTDSKELAELSMIVDLVRNDLGKICEIGSVKVTEHARVTPLSYLYHLVSDISGKLPASIKIAEILTALFPCASITGAPKIAAMKYISVLEQVSRGLYTGAVGYGNNTEITCAVAIRTAQHYGETTIISSGGGITIDSDPELEYQESLVKAAIFGI